MAPEPRSGAPGEAAGPSSAAADRGEGAMQGGTATDPLSKDATLPASAAAGGARIEQPRAPARRRRKGEAPKDQRALNQAFSKHKAGLFSKAAELSRLSTDARVFVFVGSAARGISWAYATGGKFSRRTIGRRRKREEGGGGGGGGGAAASRPRLTKKSKTYYSNDTRTAESAVLQLLRGAASAADGGREYAPETAVIGEEKGEVESESESEEEEGEGEEQDKEAAAAAAAAAAAKASSSSSSSDSGSGSDSDSSDDEDSSEDDGSSSDSDDEDEDDESSSDGDSSDDDDDDDDEAARGDAAAPPPPPPLVSANEDVFSLEEGEELVPLPMEAALAPAPPPPASVARLSEDARRTVRGRR